MSGGLVEPFHVSRSSDGENQWFSAYDPAGGTSIRAKDREDARHLVGALNRSVRVAVSAALHDQAATITALRDRVTYLEALVEVFQRDNPPLSITALQAEVAALRPFVQHFAKQPCACAVIPGLRVECSPCAARAALERPKP